MGGHFATSKSGSIAQHLQSLVQDAYLSGNSLRSNFPVDRWRSFPQRGLAEARHYCCGSNGTGDISTAGSSSAQAEPQQGTWAAHLANTRPPASCLGRPHSRCARRRSIRVSCCNGRGNQAPDRRTQESALARSRFAEELGLASSQDDARNRAVEAPCSFAELTHGVFRNTLEGTSLRASGLGRQIASRQYLFS